MTTLILIVGGMAVLLTSLLGATISRERRRARLETAFGPETKGLADIREASRTAHTVREAPSLHPPRGRG